MTIELATPKEHVAGANYIVVINSQRFFTANTEEEVWDIIGKQPFGACHEVRSPVGLPVDDFVPY